MFLTGWPTVTATERCGETNPQKEKKKKKECKVDFTSTPNCADLRADKRKKKLIASQSHHRHPRVDLGCEELDSARSRRNSHLLAKDVALLKCLAAQEDQLQMWCWVPAGRPLSQQLVLHSKTSGWKDVWWKNTKQAGTVTRSQMSFLMFLAVNRSACWKQQGELDLHWSSNVWRLTQHQVALVGQSH